MSTISNKIRPKVAKVINKFPTEVTIYRDIKDEFGEEIMPEVVCNIKGFYHEGSSGYGVGSSIEDKGEVKRRNSIYLMVIYDEVTIGIKENDYFELDNMKYIIKDKGNQNRLNIYFDMLLEVR